jgi:hypothetical protein
LTLRNVNTRRATSSLSESPLLAERAWAGMQLTNFWQTHSPSRLASLLGAAADHRDRILRHHLHLAPHQPAPLVHLLLSLPHCQRLNLLSQA